MWSIVIGYTLKTDEMEQGQKKKTEKTAAHFAFLINHWQSLFHEKSFCASLLWHLFSMGTHECKQLGRARKLQGDP